MPLRIFVEAMNLSLSPLLLTDTAARRATCRPVIILEATEQDLNLHGKLSERPRGVEPHLPSPHFQPLSLYVQPMRLPIPPSVTIESYIALPNSTRGNFKA